MPPARVEVRFRPGWRLELRAMACEAMFTLKGAHWLFRGALLASFGAFCAEGLGGMMTAGVGVEQLAVVLPVVALGWAVEPVAARLLSAERQGREAMKALSFHEQGFTLRMPGVSNTVAWSAVRAVRRTRRDLLVLLDSACIVVPRDALSAPDQALLERLWRGAPAGEPEPVLPRPLAPYRAGAEREPDPDAGPEDPGSWEAPEGFSESVLARPRRAELARGALGPEAWGALALPAVLQLAALFCFSQPGLAAWPGPSSRALGILLELVAMSSLLLSYSPALLHLRERLVAERALGALYAVGPKGFYLRTRRFELRLGWEGVRCVHESPGLVYVVTTGGAHAIPVRAFATPSARRAFVASIKRSLERRVASGRA